jgi:hypothetical protein
MFQERWFTAVLPHPINAFVTDLLMWQKIVCTQQQEERQEHRRIEGDAS